MQESANKSGAVSGVGDLRAVGQPFLWGFGGALAVGVLMTVGFLILVFYNGLTAFLPKPIEVVTLNDGTTIAGEPTRDDLVKLAPDAVKALPKAAQDFIVKNRGYDQRNLYRIANFDLYNEDFKWVSDYNVKSVERPKDFFFVERTEWGPFIGKIHAITIDDKSYKPGDVDRKRLFEEVRQAGVRRDAVRELERDEIGKINHKIDSERLRLKRVGMDHGLKSPEYAKAQLKLEEVQAKLKKEYDLLAQKAELLKVDDRKFSISFVDVGGREKSFPLSTVMRFYAANELSSIDKAGVYLSRWWEFLSSEPREANTEGGVFPALFGTFVMTVLMSLAVGPFGVIAALYLREYAKQGRLVSVVRICVNNLAGVPSIVYGVFGLGFFAYILGGSIDSFFFPERLPTPTFGTGGLLWSSLTLALLTVPVVIVATEEALAAVPPSMREGSLGCGASKWQTIKFIVLPRAMPGILTGLILAMARGAGEVAPLMLVGVVKLAPELPLDTIFPYIHFERSFMHLAFHIFDIGFQSRNAEAAKPVVFVTTLLLISLVGVMNAAAIVIRNRLKRKFQTGQF